jgi:hypothetical protein
VFHPKESLLFGVVLVPCHKDVIDQSVRPCFQGGCKVTAENGSEER